MTEPENTPQPPPLTINAHGLGVALETGPDGAAVVVLSMVSPISVTIARTDRAGLSGLIDHLAGVLAELPGGLVVPTAEETTRLNGHRR